MSTKSKCELHLNGHEPLRIMCSGVPLKLNERQSVATNGRRSNSGLLKPVYRPATVGGPVWQHEVANHFRDFRRKRMNRPTKKRNARIEATYRSRQFSAVPRDVLDIPTMAFPRLGSNPRWRGRQTICQQHEAQHIESEHLRRIRTASTLSDFHRLLDCNPRPSAAAVRCKSNYTDDGQFYDSALVSSHKAQQSQHLRVQRFDHYRQCQSTNPISDTFTRNNFLATDTPAHDSDADDQRHFASGVTYAASTRRPDGPSHQPTTHHCERRRHKSPSTHHHHRFDGGHASSSSSSSSLSSLRRHAFCNNRDVGAEVPPPFNGIPIQHIVDVDDDDDDDNHLNDDGGVDEFDYEFDKDDEDTLAAENIEWYIRLASRCYREGFKWHADYLRNRTARTEAHQQQPTRRPLRRIVEQYLQKQNETRRAREADGVQSRHFSEDEDNDEFSSVVNSTATTPKGRCQHKIRIDISSAGSSTDQNMNGSTVKAMNRTSNQHVDDYDGDDVRADDRYDRKLAARNNINNTFSPHHFNHSATPQQLSGLFDQMCSLNNTTRRRDDSSLPLPQITLTDCSIDDKRDVDDDDGDFVSPKSTPVHLLTPSGVNQSSNSDFSTSASPDEDRDDSDCQY